MHNQFKGSARFIAPKVTSVYGKLGLFANNTGVKARKDELNSFEMEPSIVSEFCNALKHSSNQQKAAFWLLLSSKPERCATPLEEDQLEFEI